MIKVMIVDDQELIREGLALLLNENNEIDLIAEAKNGIEAVARAQEHSPDIILMDIQMPELDGLEASKLIKENNPEIKILILSVFGEEELVKEAIRSGAEGYLLKDISKEELFKAINDVYAGKAYLHGDLAKSILDDFANDRRRKRKNVTKREREILKLISEGKSNKQIADILNLSIETVKTHIRNIFEKLEAADRAQAVAIALKKHLLR